MYWNAGSHSKSSKRICTVWAELMVGMEETVDYKKKLFVANVFCIKNGKIESIPF